MHRSHKPSPDGARRHRLAALVVAVLAATFGMAAPSHANVPGSALYVPSSGNEGMAYDRMIRLADSGTANGTILATFEHWDTTGAQSDYVIRKSTDDGASWSTLSTVPGDTFSYQPFLYEYPHQIGAYPAGTLLLVGATLPANRAGVTFREWRSFDHGATWSYVGAPQVSNGADGSGIWEPFVGLDSAGNMLMYFSDERQNTVYSQFLGHIVSTDGGDTWSANPDGSTRVAPGEVKDVASTAQADRPGMITIADIGTTGRLVASYELCGPNYNCDVHYKTSTDGDTWGSGPADLGTRAQTGDGRYLQGTPVITWSPKGGTNGELLLSGHGEVRAAGGTPETAAVVLVNTNSGSGSWNWMPSPIAVPTAGAPSSCGTNYSPDLLVSADGSSVRYTAAGVAGPYNCEELTGSANAGVLPDTVNFGSGDAGWDRYGGSFSTSGNVYSETAGGTGGNKAITGSTAWGNYTLAGDVQLNNPGANGNAGFLVRATDPTVGTDNVNGYYVGVTGSNVVIGKEAYGWTQLASTPIPGGLAANAWYHLTVGVDGCDITVQGAPAGGYANPTYLHINDCSFGAGSVGVRDYDSAASWQNIHITTAGAITGPGTTGKCVDDNTNTDTNGNAVQLYDCNGVTGQQWSSLADGTLRAYGKCLDIVGDGTANFTKVELWDCNGVGGQQWVPRADGSLFNPQSGRCLDDPQGVTTNQTQLQIYDCNQQWTQVWNMPK